MYIYQLIEEYQKRFGIFPTLKRNIKMNRWILVYLLVGLSCPLVFLYLFTQEKQFHMIAVVTFYILFLNAGGYQHKRWLLKRKPVNTLGYKVQPFLKMMDEVFYIRTNEQLLRVGEIIKQEIAAEEFSRKSPLSTILRQMIVAVPITGLLSYGFMLIREGDGEKAAFPFLLYILILGFVFIVGELIKLKREFGSTAYLTDISVTIQLALLELSIQGERKMIIETEVAATNEKILGTLPPRSSYKKKYNSV